ncbi:oxygen-independent coproporphyrinogen III oxidase [Vannielia litorea]|uniref:oxygen-independent coproporphyrinogen III oxidase n=1 Tax=Vannielia litorea TaxID=1217970 RepID=UPI001BCE228B|nr:oxygen-independent coproporphyrinogen III oxidase [Vannielia litorea]MBS8226084.1 oxygen-independent coproporphyrinogen III oxidase [Vannielia litorea]
METTAQLARHGLFDARVPRYTSYPTAPHFAGGVDVGRFAQWLRAIPENGKISLYIHVPFCRRLCWFCACRTQGTSSGEPVRAYLDVLKAEIALLAQNLAPGVRLSRMHWGGGTPTLMEAPMMEELAAAVEAVVPMAPGAEFSVEIDPNEIDEARLDALAAAGMTRASIGVQDFDPEIQKVIGRDQSYELTAWAVEMIRARGIESLNADILFGLPHQTDARMASSVQKLMSLSPDRVALYGYAHVPWMAKRQSLLPTDALPTPEQRLALFETARRLFRWDGYDEIGIDHFARPGDGLARALAEGRLRRNFQGYTDDTATALVGLGASSISRFPQGYAQNASATSAYIRDVREGRFATARGHSFSKEDLWRGRMIEQLMCEFRCDVDQIVATGARPDWVRSVLSGLAARFDGVVSLTPTGLAIPPAARPLTRVIARAIDAYDLSRAGHSSAI